jgi:hypothetical protein
MGGVASTVSANICIKYRKAIPCAKSLFAQNAHYNGYLPLFWSLLTILLVIFVIKSQYKW